MTFREPDDHRPVFYVSCSYTGKEDFPSAAVQFEALIDQVYRALKGDVLFFLPHCHTWGPFRNGHPPASNRRAPEDIYRIDSHAIDQADGMIALLQEPSHGVGAEIARMDARGKPILGFADRHVSSYIKGLLCSSIRSSFHQVEKLDAQAIASKMGKYRVAGYTRSDLRDAIVERWPEWRVPHCPSQPSYVPTSILLPESDWDIIRGTMTEVIVDEDWNISAVLVNGHPWRNKQNCKPEKGYPEGVRSVWESQVGDTLTIAISVELPDAFKVTMCMTPAKGEGYAYRKVLSPDHPITSSRYRTRVLTDMLTEMIREASSHGVTFRSP